MGYSVFYTFGIAFAIVLLAKHYTEAKSIHTPGILDAMPENCTGLEFCFEPHQDYPEKKINWLLTEKFHLKLSSIREATLRNRDTIVDERSDCKKDMKFGPIYEIIDQNDNVRIVVQSPDVFYQQISVERCLNGPRQLTQELDLSTVHFSGQHLSEFNISCKEKTFDYNFLVLTPNGEDIEFVKSKNGVPIDCDCNVQLTPKKHDDSDEYEEEDE